MILQFVLSPELQQFIAGLQSKATANVQFNIDFGDETPPTLPTNPNTIRRSLMFSKAAYSEDATPTLEYNAYIQTLDGSTVVAVSEAREL